MKARKDSLEEILSHRAYTAESVKRLFTTIARGEAEDFQAAGVLADFVDVEPAYEKAAEDFLHEELEYVVVENWNDAERGIDIMRTDLDGRATFLVHPESERTSAGAGHAGGRARRVGRLSDHLRFTNGFATAPRDLLPRLAHCFLGQNRSAAQKLATEHPELFFLLPDGVSYHGHAVSGGKKTGQRSAGSEARVARVDRRSTDQTARSGRRRRWRWSNWKREIAGLSEDLESLRACSKARRKTRWRWIMSIVSWPKNLRGRKRNCQWRGWSWNACGKKAAGPGNSRSAISSCWMNAKQQRSVEEQVLEQSRADFEELQTQAHQSGEEHGRCGRNWRGLKNGSVSSAPPKHGMRLGSQRRRLAGRRSRPKWSAWVWSGRGLLSDNIELDRRAGELVEAILAAEQFVDRVGRARNYAAHESCWHSMKR